MALMLVAAGVVVWPGRRRSPLRRRPRRRHRANDPGLEDVARLLLVAGSAGLTLGASLLLVAEQVPGDMGSAVRSVTRRARVSGLSRALLDAPAALHPLASMLARAQVSGSSVTATLEVFVERSRRAAVAAAVARAKRAGVLLVIPLSLLLLPGFGLVLFGPYLLRHLEYLLGGV